MDFKPSEYQQAVFDVLLNSKNNLIVEAVAGSGKTTTLLKALDMLVAKGETPGKMIFVAFNKNIANELENKVPARVDARTFNSLGHRTLYGAITAAIKLDKKKIWNILMELRSDKTIFDYEYGMYASGAHQLVDLARQIGIGVLCENTDSEWLDLIDYYDIYFQARGGHDPDPYRAIEIAQQVLATSNRQAEEGIIDFADQLYLPILWNLGFKEYGLVFVDECQDVNLIQREIIRRILGRNGRLVAVGDTRQAIYGFRGAQCDAMQEMEEAFNATPLPLSICYRCPEAVVKEAKKIVPQIEAAPNAYPGYLDSFSVYSKKTFEAGQVILCRNNKPLVAFAYELISRGVGCAIRGQDIARGLKQLIEKMDAKNSEELVDKLKTYKTKMVFKYIKEGHEEKAEALEDKVATVLTIMDNQKMVYQFPNDLFKAIDDLFTDNGENLVLLSSIHKAKGLEWETVFFLDAGLIPSKYARRDWQLQQESNLYYVAITRSTGNLIFIASDTWGEHDPWNH